MQVSDAVDSLYSEFKAVDNLVARNTTRVLKAFQNARLGSHVSSFLFNSDIMSKMVHVILEKEECIEWIINMLLAAAIYTSHSIVCLCAYFFLPMFVSRSVSRFVLCSKDFFLL